MWHVMLMLCRILQARGLTIYRLWDGRRKHIGVGMIGHVRYDWILRYRLCHMLKRLRFRGGGQYGRCEWLWPLWVMR